VARALAAAAGDASSPTASRVRELTGAGIEGTVEGRRVMVSSAAHAAAALGGLPTAVREQVSAMAEDGLSPVVVTIDGRAAAVAGLGDPLRTDSRESVAAIRDSGWQVEILSGDHPAVVEGIAREVGVPASAARGGASPEDKLEAVRAASAEGTAVMVGDGVNDAAALAAATVGIGVHGGAEAALAAADAYLGHPGLAPVAELLEGARRTLGVIRRNLVLSLAYNVVAVSFAITGHMSPILAAILMPLSSMTVVLSSYRARTF
jgi:Cu2+-exporting ATPase